MVQVGALSSTVDEAASGKPAAIVLEGGLTGGRQPPKPRKTSRLQPGFYRKRDTSSASDMDATMKLNRAAESLYSAGGGAASARVSKGWLSAQSGADSPDGTAFDLIDHVEDFS